VNDKAIHRILFFFLGIAAVLLAVAFQAVRNINRSVAASDWVNHTHSVILEAEALRTALYVSDAMMRTYAQSGDVRDLAACRDGLANALDHLDIAKALTRHEPTQHDQVIQIESLVNPRAEFIQALLKARQAGDTETVRTMFNADAGSTVIREIQRKIDKLKDEELTLLTERDTASYLQAQTTRWTVWAGVVLDVLLLGGVAWLIRDDLSARRRVAATLQDANEQLETRVRERTAELASANTQLSTENLERQWANQALEHQLRYNHLIVDSISDLVLVLTKALNISRVNPAVIHLTGLEPAALINQPLARILRLVAAPDDTGGPMRDPIAQALRDGRDLRGQAGVVEDKRGRQISVHVSMFPLRDRDKVVGGIMTLQIIPPGTATKA
jgi:PAS domain S-box-containing protein